MATEKISLKKLEIEDLRAKRTMTEGLMIEVPGVEGDSKANRLATKMAAVLEPHSVRVTRPSKRAELYFRGLDDLATSTLVSMALAKAGECSERSIKVGDVRRSPSGIGTVCAQCPLLAARKITKAGSIKVG